MKLTLFLAFFLSVAYHAKACIRVHARLLQAPWPEQDGMGIEVWDNDNVYEKCGCAWQSYAGKDCTAKCGKFTVTVGRNGRGGRVTNNNNGYSATLKTQNVAKPENWCCLFGENGTCRGQCQVWDNCSWDAFGNCNKYQCKLCGGKQLCGSKGTRKRSPSAGGEEVFNSTFLDFGEVFDYTVEE